MIANGRASGRLFEIQIVLFCFHVAGRDQVDSGTKEVLDDHVAARDLALDGDLADLLHSGKEQFLRNGGAGSDRNERSARAFGLDRRGQDALQGDRGGDPGHHDGGGGGGGAGRDPRPAGIRQVRGLFAAGIPPSSSSAPPPRRKVKPTSKKDAGPTESRRSGIFLQIFVRLKKWQVGGRRTLAGFSSTPMEYPSRTALQLARRVISRWRDFSPTIFYALGSPSGGNSPSACDSASICTSSSSVWRTSISRRQIPLSLKFFDNRNVFPCNGDEKSLPR